MPPCQNSAYLQCDDIDQNSWLYVVEEEELWFAPHHQVVGHVSELVLTARVLLFVSLSPQTLELKHSRGRVQTQQLLLVNVSDADVDLKHVYFTDVTENVDITLDTSVDHEANLSSHI